MACIYEYGNLNLVVNPKPFGGFRGEIGTLGVIYGENALPFTSWEKNDLKALATLTQKILSIHEMNHVCNTLIYGRQNAGGFILEFVPYPKCDWREKVQGAFHAVFGSPRLQESDIDAITLFYQEYFKSGEEEQKELGEDEDDALQFLLKNPPAGKPDPFCRAEVIDRQRITSKETRHGKYDILHDNRPKGAVKSDPHILIVPEDDAGHVDGAQVSVEMRVDMLSMVQEAMQAFLNEGYTTLLYIERNGAELQGVKHKHSHAVGIKHFPESFWEKTKSLFRLAWPGALSDTDLENRIKHYRTKLGHIKED
ncbi:MAG: hypothetical protein CK425_11525 [Parachlamydia sp.]|nr:MAG: hypothetical protein CK425_11525 [Parachlamydia sp.]